ncbi:ABC transporter substrate-binding protein [Saccharomonospora sp. NPDC046836]|uniref:ABC transporter substrate-binding protein n=1 Tax=Saccharomonospora sp. NPDC046836 TaxID=3156921 RepID=UPI0033DA12C6
MVLVAALNACTLAGGDTQNGNAAAVRVGFMYDVHAANVWTLDQCSSDEVAVELTSFKQFAEIQRALEQGQIDVGMMGYQNMAQMLDNGYEDFRAVAGVYTGGEHISIRAGSGITDWADLRGKKVGVPPNSFVEMLLRSSLREAGVSIDDIELVPFAGAGPPMQTALRNGEIDAMVAWEPNAATVDVDGYGEYADFNIQDGAIGDATSLLYASETLLADQQGAVDEVVRCLRERTEALSADVEQWVTALTEHTGLPENVARTAIETGEMDIKLYQDSAERIITEFAENGLVEDTSGRVAEFFDYSSLQRVTGLDRAELGAK